MEKYIETIIMAALGSGGVVGIFFLIFRYYIEKLLDARDEKRRKAHEYQVKKDELGAKKDHCTSRFLFWMHKAIVDGHHNGDLEEAFSKMQEAERECKEFERRRLAELYNEE